MTKKHFEHAAKYLRMLWADLQSADEKDAERLRERYLASEVAYLSLFQKFGSNFDSARFIETSRKV